MEYNEKYFARSANKKAMGMWLTVSIVLSAVCGDTDWKVVFHVLAFAAR